MQLHGHISDSFETSYNNETSKQRGTRGIREGRSCQSQQLEPQHDQTLIEKKDEREKREEWEKIEKDRREREKERELREKEWEEAEERNWVKGQEERDKEEKKTGKVSGSREKVKEKLRRKSVWKKRVRKQEKMG